MKNFTVSFCDIRVWRQISSCETEHVKSHVKGNKNNAGKYMFAQKNKIKCHVYKCRSIDQNMRLFHRLCVTVMFVSLCCLCDCCLCDNAAHFMQVMQVY